MMKLGAAALAAAISLGAFALPSHASTITDNFAFTNASNTTVASGSFSYDSSKSGVLGYGDLSAFSVTALGQSYDLAFAIANASGYTHFAFDTATMLFTSQVVGGYDDLLSAADGILSTGFFISPILVSNNIGAYNPFIEGTWTSYTVAQVAATPIPAALPLFVSALGVMGFAGWRRKRAASAA